MSTADEHLIVEDLMLLLLHDDGASISGAGTLHYTLGGAVLVELALLERVELDENKPSVFSGPIVVATGEGPLDPLLQRAWDEIARKPHRVQTHLLNLGTPLRQEVIDRLVERGLVKRTEGRFLKVFPRVTFPEVDGRPEAALRARISAVLEDGAEPDPRTAATIGLLYASGAMPALRPPLTWNSTTVTRARQIQEGHRGSSAVADAVTRTAAAIAAATATATAAAIASAGN